MRWYRCLILGENFPKRMDPNEDIALYGFYTTRWVEADTPEAAESAALSMMRGEDNFALPDGYTGPVTAKIYFEEIDEVEGPQPQGGATWFPMESSEPT